MATYLLTWNPKRWQWSDLFTDANAVSKYGYVRKRWSCGNTKRIKKGDRVFLLRQCLEPRGIIASGTVSKGSYLDTHWDPKRNTQTWFVEVDFDVLQDPETDPILLRDWLEAPEYADVYWNTQASGISVPPHVERALSRAWASLTGSASKPPLNQINQEGPLYEGAPRAVKLNVYERSREARRRCLAHYGTACIICGFDFGHRYGSQAKGFIHVHHLRPVSDFGERYVVDPVADLRPVCPNCHAVLHRKSPPYSIEDMREMMSLQASLNPSSLTP